MVTSVVLCSARLIGTSLAFVCEKFHLIICYVERNERMNPYGMLHIVNPLMFSMRPPQDHKLWDGNCTHC